jgi:hypothetical protein
MKRITTLTAAFALMSGMAMAENPMVGGAAMFETKNIGNCPACWVEEYC